MTWMMTANLGQRVTAERVAIAKDIGRALAETKHPTPMQTAIRLVRRGKRVELFTMEQMIAVGQQFNEHLVCYKIYRLTREDISILAPGVVGAAAVSA